MYKGGWTRLLSRARIGLSWKQDALLAYVRARTHHTCIRVVGVYCTSRCIFLRGRTHASSRRSSTSACTCACIYVDDYVGNDNALAKSSPRDRKKEQQFIAHDSGHPYACTTFRIILRANSSQLTERVLLSLFRRRLDLSVERSPFVSAGNQRNVLSFDEASDFCFLFRPQRT